MGISEGNALFHLQQLQNAEKILFEDIYCGRDGALENVPEEILQHVTSLVRHLQLSNGNILTFSPSY